MYPFRDIEQRWQDAWRNNNTYAAQVTSSKPRSYVLEMLPYPSGKLHMGHVRNYTIGDAIARYKTAQGFEVLHPMGWDAFGLPAENAAMEHKVHPQSWTNSNIANMREQLQQLGFGYDWSREVNTSDPSYYGHEQRLFIEFYQKGLVSRKESWVNWDPVDNSVLANEQVVNGRGWRSGALVEKRKLNQWSLKITHYAQELLDDLNQLDGWPEKVVRMQENWIGRSEGAFLVFHSVQKDFSIDIFTTRPETLYGASFCAISPAHPLAEEFAKNNSDLAAFIHECHQTPTTEEAMSTVEKKGVFTGHYVQHPLQNDVQLPVYIANFVLMDYGTGAIFACPAHDERDFEFAQKYNLPIKSVIQPDGKESDTSTAYTGPGTLIHSDFLNGLSVSDARQKIINHLESNKLGTRQITYRLRDWCVSRQRYWGCPIPIIHCNDCGVVPVPLNELPVKLPEDVTFDRPGNPLDHHPTWKHVNCPSCGKAALRDTDTLDTFFESSWYFLRYCCPNAKDPVDPEAAQWMPVEWYIGGIEHAVMHLLYARFFTKALRDLGYLSFDEPFKNLLTQGMVCHRTYQDAQGRWLYPQEVESNGKGGYQTLDGQPATMGRSEKMSKSKKNLVDPLAIIDAYGADSARLFIMSDTPPDRDFDWSDDGVEGCWRYLNRVWRLGEVVATYQAIGLEDPVASLSLRKATHQTIAKITQSYDRQAFNKAIALIRELTRTLEESLETAQTSQRAVHECLEVILITLHPIVPHMTSEIWSLLHRQADIREAKWPQAEPMLAVQDQVSIAVQVNGKMRGSFEVNVDSPQDVLQEMALNLPNVRREVADKPLRRVIIVPNRIVNLVV